MINHILEVENVTKRYPNGRGLEGISFTVNKGEIFGLLGPNGAGKTTMLKVIVQLSKLDQGFVRIGGVPVKEKFKEAISNVGCMIGDRLVYEDLTANQNVQLVSRFYPHIKQERMEEVLRQVQLSYHRNEKVYTFSAGMKQRLAMALAMYSRPSLLLLDEPTNGLDPEAKQMIHDVIKQLSKEGTAILISSHLLADMEQLCDQVGLLYTGRLLAVGDVEEFTRTHSLEQFYLEKYKEFRRGEG